MEVIKYKFLFIGFSSVLVLVALISMFGFGFKQGIDFIGGTLWDIQFQADGISSEAVNTLLLEKKIDGLFIRQGATSREFLIRMRTTTEAEHQELFQLVKSRLGPFEELSFSSIGPAIGLELRQRALLAFFLVLLGISFYIAFAFRKVSEPVSSWKYGMVTLITLFHDALIPAGLFAFWGWKYGIELDTNFIVAILVVMGFSVHDTIVVFDRIRETLLRVKAKGDLGSIINASINQTFGRSINTSLTLFLVLVALYVFGAESLRYFTLLILIGTMVGTYSSIFVASPLLTLVNKKS